MQRIAKIILLSLVIAVSAMAQSFQQKPEAKVPDAKPSDSPPTVDQILDKYIQAVGGKAAFEKLTTRVMNGSIDVEGIGASGSLEFYAKAPNKFMDIINISGFGTFQEGFDGTVGWELSPQAGLRELSGAELAGMRREAEFHLKDIKLKELYPRLALKGKQKVGNREAYVLEATPADGGPEKMYYDTQTGLLIRREVERERPEGKLPFEYYFEDYKEVDGVKLPFTLRRSRPSSWIIKLNEIKHNVLVDDTKFNKPTAQ